MRPNWEAGESRPASEISATYDVEAEQFLLGALLAGGSALIEKAAAILEPEHFFDPLHARIFEGILALQLTEPEVTPLVLWAVMKADPGLLEVGGRVYLAGLCGVAPALPNMAKMARAIRELSIRRGPLNICEQAAGSVQEGKPTLDICAEMATAIETKSLSSSNKRRIS